MKDQRAQQRRRRHMGEVQVSDVRFAAAAANETEHGHLGWVSFCVGKLKIDGVTVRRTLDGRLTLSFPARTDSAGWQHFYIRPLDDATRREIERQVFAQLRIAKRAPR